MAARKWPRRIHPDQNSCRKMLTAVHGTNRTPEKGRSISSFDNAIWTPIPMEPIMRLEIHDFL
jgi:hypothetical protein